MRRIRFGIMCFGTTLTAWEAECVRELLDLEAVEVALLIVEKKSGTPRPKRRLLRKLKTLLMSRNSFWLLYQRLFVDGRIEALRPVDMSATLSQVPRLECEVLRKGRFSEYFKEEDLARIRQYDLDFLLRFAFGIIRGDILSAPRYGVWSFHHDDEERYRGGPPAFWEIYYGDPLTGVVLQRLTDRLDGGIVLRKRHFPTVVDSYVRNRDAGLFGAARWPAEVCRDIQLGDDTVLQAPPSRSSAPVLSSPTNWQLSVFVARMARNFLARRFAMAATSRGRRQ